MCGEDRGTGRTRVRPIPAPGWNAPTTEPPPETVRGSASASVATSALLRPPARSSSVAATIVEARVAPSSIFNATVVPFEATITMTPSAPCLVKTPSFSIAIVSGRPGPSIVHGLSRTARTSEPATR
jgi:hypothetical protein